MTSERQITLEQLMADLGRERYWARVHSQGNQGHTTDSPAGRHLLREAVDAVSDAFSKWRRWAKAGKSGRNAHLVVLLADMPTKVVAMIAVRTLLDLASRNEDCGMAAAAHQVASALEEEARFRALKRAAPTLWKDLRKRIKARRDRRKRTKLLSSGSAKAGVPLEEWARSDKLRLGTVLIELITETTKLVSVVKVHGPRSRVRRVLSAAPETLNWLEKSHEAHESMFPFYLPTFDLPLEWENPYDGGYHSNLVVRKPFVKAFSRTNVELAAQADMPLVYRAVNAIQDTAWEVNPDVYEVARTLWDSGVPVADMPERVDEPPVPKPADIGTNPEARKAYMEAAGKRYERLAKSRSRRLLHSKIMFMAQKFVGETFYFPHSADFRGRLYPIPFFLQPQGCNLARGLLRFAAAKWVTPGPALEWFKIHGANCFGVDKVSFAERLRWVADNHENIMSVGKDPLDNRWWANADKPWEFLAWCLEYYNADFDGGFWSQIPVHMDGSNNGLQIFSLLMRDEVGAEATNCLPSDAPKDIYQNVADDASARVAQDPDPLGLKWTEFYAGRLPRKAVKRQVMTLPYGETFHACIHYTRDWYEEQVKAGAAPVGQGYGPSVFLAKHVWDAINDSVGPAKACMGWLQDCAKRLAKAGIFVRWTAPSGFPVRQEYSKYASRSITTTVGEKVRQVRYRKDTGVPAPKAHANGIAPNYVHSLDAAILATAVCKAKDRGVDAFAVVHDSYGTHAADAAVLAECIREAYAEMFSVDLLDVLHKELSELGRPAGVVLPEPPERGNLDVSRVKDSRYFFA